MEHVSSFAPDRLLSARKARGLSHDRLAVKVGCTRSTLIAYEKGRLVPSSPRLVELAQALDVDPLELMTVTAATATLADLRARAGLTRPQLAERALVAPSHLGNVETGRARPSHALIERLAAALELTVDDIEAAVERALLKR